MAKATRRPNDTRIAANPMMAKAKSGRGAVHPFIAAHPTEAEIQRNEINTKGGDRPAEPEGPADILVFNPAGRHCFFAAFLSFRAFDLSVATRRGGHTIVWRPTTKDNHNTALPDAHFFRDEPTLSHDRGRFYGLLRDHR